MRPSANDNGLAAGGGVVGIGGAADGPAKAKEFKTVARVRAVAFMRVKLGSRKEFFDGIDRRFDISTDLKRIIKCMVHGVWLHHTMSSSLSAASTPALAD